MPVNYPKFDKKIQDQIDLSQMQRSRSRPGVIMSYNNNNNTAVVVLEDHHSENVGNIIKDVVCPSARGVQIVAPVPGSRCLIGFRDNNEAKPYVINYYDDTNSGYNRAYQYRVNTGIPRFMVH